MQTPIALKLLIWYYNRYINLDPWGKSVQEVRAFVESNDSKISQFLNGPFIPVHKVENQTIPVRDAQIPIRIYAPSNKANLPIVLYCHGGGFVLFDLDSHDHVCRRVCSDNQVIVVSVGYRLAPEFKFPIPANDTYDALLWATENAADLGGDKTKIVLMGDSAGGNLITVAALMARDKGGPSVAAQILVYPVLDARMQQPSIKENGRGYILTESLIHWFLEQYTNEDEDYYNPYLSPLVAEDLTNLPPTLMQVAGLDPLRDQGIDYAKRLRSAGTKVQLTNYEGMTHSFFSMPGLSKRCRAAYQEINGFLSKHDLLG